MSNESNLEDEATASNESGVEDEKSRPSLHQGMEVGTPKLQHKA
jgi:hypothetical protein